MTITGQSSLSKDEIDRMVRDAEAHAEEDRRRREEAEIRNNADSLVYQVEKLLKDQGDSVGTAERDQLQAALAEAKSTLEGGDTDAIRSATERLSAASQQLSQRLYEQASASGEPAGSTDQEVVDAEIVDEGAR